MSICGLLVPSVVVEDDVNDRKYHAHQDPQEWETPNALAPAASLLIDDWIRREHQVQRSVDDGQVDAKQKHDRLAEEEDPRAR